jgi:hypothetical protein
VDEFVIMRDDGGGVQRADTVGNQERNVAVITVKYGLIMTFCTDL